ncbi:Ankyrin repeat, PH and SEC7 domain containing protein secG [Carex littledalei]|uniref:Ankyrin repeat, PH and SEC7 domain containing protein secG n=1 Tax=Carex littledalei TaxID=544730 RepID=A0A833R4H4_9POAL|nr:Ankyrin repeat, PH and SEC7 domain containing protein secG [Carex littledalei]
MARQRNPSDVKKIIKIADAASSGNLGMVKLIGEGISEKKKERIGEMINCLVGKDGNGVLHNAAGRGYAEICEYLIEKFNVNVNSVSQSGKTPIGFAANFGNPNVIEYLIKRGANLNMQDANGFTPLHDAVVGVQPQALEVLLSRGARVNTQSFVGSPLLLATLRGDIPCMKILLDHSADPNKMLCHVVTPLLVTVMNNKKCLFQQQAEAKELAELLIKAGADVNKVPILGLAYHSKELMEYLLESGADPNLTDESGRLPIIVAAVRGKKEIVETLFPLTTPIPTMPDWSIDGLFNYVESQEYKKEREVLSKKRLVELNKKIQAALSQKEYLVALVLCTYALEERPEDASAYYVKRSRCWMHLGNAQCGVTSITYKLNSTLDANKSNSSEDIRTLGKDYLSRNDYFPAALAFGAGLSLDSEDFKNEMRGVVDCALKSGDHVLPDELEEMGKPAFTVTIDIDKMKFSIHD